MATTTNAIPQPLIYSRPLTRRAFRPTQDAGPKGRVARGAKPSCSLTWRPALSVARGMRNAMGVSVSRGKSGRINANQRGHCAGDEAQPIDAVRMSESTRASPLVPPALRAASFLVRGELRAADARSRAASCALLTRAHALRPAWFAATCALLTPAHARRPACVAPNCVLLTRAHALRPACVAPTRALLTRSHVPRIQRRAIDSRPFTRGAFRPTQDAGPKGRVARGAKPSCSLTWRPALSVARGMRNAMGVSVSRGKSAWTLRR